MSAPVEPQNNTPTNDTATNDGTSQTGTPAPTSCSCPTSPSPQGGDPAMAAHDPALLSAEINADLSGVQANADILGHDIADVSIGLGIVEDVLGLAGSGVGTGIGLVDAVLDLADSKLGLVDQMLCDVV